MSLNQETAEEAPMFILKGVYGTWVSNDPELRQEIRNWKNRLAKIRRVEQNVHNQIPEVMEEKDLKCPKCGKLRLERRNYVDGWFIEDCRNITSAGPCGYWKAGFL